MTFYEYEPFSQLLRSNNTTDDGNVENWFSKQGVGPFRGSRALIWGSQDDVKIKK